MNRFLVPLLFGVSILLSVVIIGMSYSVRRTSRSKMLFFVATTCLGWCTAIACFLTPSIDDSLRRFMPIAYHVSSIFLPLSLVLFANTYRKKTISPFVIYGLMIAAIALSISLFIPEIALFQSVDVDNYTVVHNRMAYLVFTIYFVLCVIVGLWVLYKNATDKGLRKKYNRINLRILVLWMVGGGFGSLFDLWLPWFGDYSLIAIGPLSVLIFIPILVVAATVDDYFSISKILIKGVIGLAGVAAVVASAFGILFVLDGFLDGRAPFAITLALSVILALLVVRLNQFLSSKIDSDGYNEAEVLRAMSQIASEKHGSAEFFRSVRHTLNKAFGVKFVDIIVFGQDTAVHVNDNGLEHTLSHLTTDKNKYGAIYREDVRNKADYATLVAHNVEVVTPIVGTMDNKVVGVIVLSPRRRRFDRYYGETLTKVSAVLSPFIQSAVFYEEISNFNARLKQQVREKTQELRESNKELMKLDEMKDDLLSIASHNLRTPLTGIIGYVDMLRDGDFGKLTKEQKTVLEEVGKSGKHMAQILGDFLDVTRIDSGRLDLKKESTNLTELVEEEVANLKEMAAKYGRKLVFHNDGKKIKITGDELHFRQVIVNLIDNAIYYGKSSIEISLTRKDGKVIFTVKDDGIGVPKEDQQKLFTKMFRASNATATRPDGSGIGLYVIKNIVEESGGKIIFESVENEGSTFGFEL